MLTSPLLDLPRLVCATPDCDTELMPRPDRDHVQQLIADGWTCSMCRRFPAEIQEPPC